MPRPKPNIDALLEEHVFSKGYTLISNKDDIKNACSYFTLQCPIDPGHTIRQCFSSLKKKPLSPNGCVHCEKEKAYKEKGASYQDIIGYFDKNDLTIINKQDYYRKWEDTIQFRCNKCGTPGEIKAVNYFVENNLDSRYDCSGCKEKAKGIVSKEELWDKISSIQSLGSKVNIDISDTVYNVQITDLLKQKFDSQSKWHLLEYNGTKKKCFVVCLDCGAKKETFPHSIFINNGRCGNCKNIELRKNVYEKLRVQCEKTDIYPLDSEPYKDINTPIKFKCNKCGYEFEKLWGRVSGNGGRPGLKCPQCHRSTKRKSQNEVATFVQSLSSDFIVEQDNRTIIAPKELDIVIPEKKVAIEYCGLLWHSDKYTSNKNYHKEKLQQVQAKGYRLITIFEDEWKHNQDICKSRIKNALGLTENRIFARKTTVKKIENKIALAFCQEHHIQGRGQAKVSYGLYYGDNLISVMTFSKPSISKNAQSKYDWELNRFCSLNGYNVVGGASKMLSVFSKEHSGILVSFCDLRWGDGGVYKALGMELISQTDPNYYYVGEMTQWIRKHRFNFTKRKLIEKYNGDPNKTEAEIAKDLGLKRVYDCGHLKFSLNISP